MTDIFLHLNVINSRLINHCPHLISLDFLRLPEYLHLFPFTINSLSMQPKHLTKTLLLMSALVVIFMAILELYWRGRGFKPAYNDDKILWANSRKEVYKPADQLTVFIGGSRIKFDLDVETWEKLTGEK